MDGGTLQHFYLCSICNWVLHHRRKQFKWKGTIRTVITAFDKLWSQLRLGMELDAINARIQDISESLWTNS